MNKKEIDMNILHDKLKEMKFSGMAEELRKQIENPNIDLVDADERIYRLVMAESQLRYDKKFNRLLKQAHLKYSDASFDESITDPARKLDVQTIQKLEDCQWIREGRNLLITGLTGAGKTYLSNAFAINALKKFLSVRYYGCSQLLKETAVLNALDDASKQLEFQKELSEVDLLILDDFGLMSLDIEKCRDLFEIIDTRDGKSSTIIISQLPVTSWYGLFKDSTYADACLDRLLYKAFRLDLHGCLPFIWSY